MSTFWRLRISTFAWGFVATYVVTGSFVTSLAVFALQAAGSTVIYWLVLR